MMPMSSTRCTPSQVPQLPCMSVASGLGNLTSTHQDGSFHDLFMPGLDEGAFMLHGAETCTGALTAGRVMLVSKITISGINMY